MMEIDWRETGLDLDLSGDWTRHVGHGRELIENALPYQIGATVDYRFLPEGLRCTIRFLLPKGSVAADSGS